MGALLGLLLCCLAGVAGAGSFKVLPLGLTLDPGRKSAMLRLLNTGSTPVTVQLEAMAWTQDDRGRDHYRPTGDLLFFPRLMTLPAGEEGVVRVAYRGPPPGDRESSYRLYAQEIPLPGAGRLRMALRIGVPVFVAPRRPSPRWRLETAEGVPGEVRVWLGNEGNSHVLLRRIGLRATSGDWLGEGAGWYLLPGTRRPFVVPLPAGRCHPGEPIEVVVEDTNGARQSRTLEAPPCAGDGTPHRRASD